MKDNFKDYEIIFTNGKDEETHLLNYHDTNNYDDIKDYAELYANDEASEFLEGRGYKVKTITKFI